MKHLGIDMTKGVKDLNTEDQEMLLRKIKENLNKWRDILCSCIGRLDKMLFPLPPRMMQRFKAIPIKIPAGFYLQ